MECLWGFTSIHFATPAASRRPPYPVCSVGAGKNRIGLLRARVNGDDVPLLQAASEYATLQPLFVDPYVGCLVPPSTKIDSRDWTHHHCIATKFIDDQLLSATRDVDGPKQVVLLTDGMDTRPYRLSWPNSTLIFDISPGKVYQETAQKLKDAGARIAKTCFLIHVPLESSDIQQELYRKGFNGNRPSVWALQGLPLMTLAGLEDVLFNVSSLAMKDSVMVGELPAWFAESEFVMKSSRDGWVEKLFLSHGFRFNVIAYEEMARSLGRELQLGDPDQLVFSGEHLRHSDAQMEIWRSEFQRMEEEGDEDGFEDL
ncbi:hypothetical protein V2J09_016084 [Rumex salicifolius]